MLDHTVVIAIGGNALIKDTEHRDLASQYAALGEITPHIATLVSAGWRVAIGHGNGPQVGFALRRSEIAATEVPPESLDVSGADTQGWIGYFLQQNIHNSLRAIGSQGQAVTVITQVEVDPADPAFQNPSKPIGAFMDKDEAMRRRAEGWSVMEDANRGWRRAVPSPVPLRIVEEAAIATLLAAGAVVITVGGGGIPVVRDARGALHGVAAVIDKDLSCALLANRLGAEALVICTGVERIALDFGKPNQMWVDHLTLSQAKQYLAEGRHFAQGSMAPKVEAVIRYLEQGGVRAIITDIPHIERALSGEAGTHITRT